MDSMNFSNVLERLSQDATPHAETNVLFADGCRALECSLEMDLCEERVHEGVRLIISLSSMDRLPINDVLKVWKIYLHFLKQHQDKIKTHFSEKIVKLLLKHISEGLELSFLNSMPQISDCAALAKKIQLLLFFCQRLFTTVVYLSPTLCDNTIQQSYEQLFLCRGVCFELGRTFSDQASITAKLSKFDVLFSNCLELQPSQLHRVEVLQRRQNLYHTTVKRLCLSPGEGVQNRYILLGILSYSSSVLSAARLFQYSMGSDSGTPDKTPPALTLLLQLQEVIWAAECLNTYFCGEVNDEIIRDLVVKSGQSISHLLVHSSAHEERGKVLGRLVVQCLQSASISDGDGNNNDNDEGSGASACCSRSSTLRTAVRLTWSRVLLVVVFATAARSLVAGKESLKGSNCVSSVHESIVSSRRGETQEDAQGDASVPVALLRIVLGLVQRAHQSRTQQAVLSPSLGLLCRALLLASVGVCKGVSGGSEGGGAIIHCVSRAASALKHAVVILSRTADVSRDGAEAVLRLALPFPEILSFADSGDIVLHGKMRTLESMTLLLSKVCCSGQGQDEPPRQRYDSVSAHSRIPVTTLSPPLSVCDILNILQMQCLATSVRHESTSSPTPLLGSDHAVVILAGSLLKKTIALSRYVSRSCSKLVAAFPRHSSSRKRSVAGQQSLPLETHSAPKRESVGFDFSQASRVLRVLKGLLLLLSSLQHILPLVYHNDTAKASNSTSSNTQTNTSTMSGTQSSQVASLVDGAVSLAKQVSSMLSQGGLQQQEKERQEGHGEPLLLLGHQLLLASCELIKTASLCNGLLNQDSLFNKCREAFMLLFECLGAASSCSVPTHNHRVDVVHSLTLALMWNTLLQTSIDFGEKVRVYPTLRNKVATLVPTRMLHLVQARVGGNTARLQFLPQSGGAAARPGNSNRWRLVAALAGLQHSDEVI